MDSENSSTFAEPSGQGAGDFDVDQALSNIEERPSITPADPGKAPIPSQQSAEKVAQEIAFKHRDQEIKVPFGDPRLSQWASQGYDYSQRMEQFNNDRRQFESQARQYQELNNFFSQNPQVFEQVLNAVKGQHGSQAQVQAKSMLEELGGQDNPFVKEILDLKSQTSEMKNYFEQIKQEKLSEQRKQEDSKLDQEIQSIREKYKNLDWSSIDEQGKNLERRVLENASRIGTQSFDLAFKDLMHEELVKRAQAEARENYVAEVQQKKKSGLLGTTPTPTKAFQAPKNIKNRSYNSLVDEAVAEVQEGRWG